MTQTRFAAFLQRRFADRFTKPSQTVFLLLALGFVLSSVRHTIANYLWRSGACLLRHYTRFYAFLGGPFFQEMDGLWRAVIRQAARQVPEGEPIRLRVDETVCKKSGEDVRPADTYLGWSRDGAPRVADPLRNLFCAGGDASAASGVVGRQGPWDVGVLNMQTAREPEIGPGGGRFPRRTSGWYACSGR